MNINYRGFRLVLVKLLERDVKLMIPQTIENLESTRAKNIIREDRDKIFDELVALHGFMYSVVLNKRYYENASSIIGEFDEVFWTYFIWKCPREKTQDMMIKIKERMIEYFEKYSEFIERASESGALMRLSAFLVEKILGPECKNDPVIVYEMADHIGVNIKGIDEYFEGCQKTFVIE